MAASEYDYALLPFVDVAQRDHHPVLAPPRITISDREAAEQINTLPNLFHDFF